MPQNGFDLTSYFGHGQFSDLINFVEMSSYPISIEHTNTWHIAVETFPRIYANWYNRVAPNEKTIFSVH